MGLCQSCCQQRHRRSVWEELDAPPPRPPKYRRVHLYQPENFTAVDKSARKRISEKILLGTLEGLCDHVTRRATDDLGSVRAIFTYLATTNWFTLAEKLREAPSYKGSALDRLEAAMEGPLSLAQLFADMCRSVGVPCKVIKGISKNSNYEIGGALERNKIISHWNAVLLDGQWRLVDVCWGSSSVIGRRSKQWAIASVDGERIDDKEYVNDGIMCRLQNDFYFLTDPDAFVCTHLPDDAAWQLLPAAVSEKQFESYVYTREHFFTLGLYMIGESHQNGTLLALDGEIRVAFGAPEDSIDDLEFSYLLFKTSGGKLQNKSLERTVMFSKTSSTVGYTVWFPMAGNFRLDIFGRRKENRNHRFDIICSYILKCTSPKPGFEMLPDNPEIGWGFGETARRFGLGSPSHTEPEITTTDGKVRMTFSLSEDINLAVALKGNKQTCWDLQDYVTALSDDGRLTVDIRLPKEGQYAINIFAASPHKDGEMSNVLNYLVRCPRQLQERVPFQRIEDGIFGARRYVADQFDIRPVSHPGGTITTEDGKADVQFSIKKQTSVRLLAEITHSVIPGDALHNQVTSGPEAGQFQLNLAEAGVYGMNIFCQDTNFPDRQHHVHSYLVRNRVLDEAVHIEDIKTSECPYSMAVSRREIHLHTTPGQQLEINHPRTERPIRVVFSRINVQEPTNNNSVQTIRLAEGGTSVIAQLKKFGDYKLDVYEELGAGVVQTASHRITRRPLNRAEELLLSGMEEGRTVYGHKGDVFVRAQMKIGLALSQKEPVFRGLLRTAVERFKQRHLDDSHGDLKRAECIIKVWDIEAALKGAIQTGEIAELQAAISMAEEGAPNAITATLKVNARKQLIGKFGENIIRKMDQTTFAEVKSYTSPPQGVFNVMQGVFMLLGVDGKYSRAWDRLRGMMGDARQMKEKIRIIRPDDIDEETAADATAILCDLDQLEVARLSHTVDNFYVWALHMIKLKSDQKQMQESKMVVAGEDWPTNDTESR